MSIVNFLFPKFCFRCSKKGYYICKECLDLQRRVLPRCYECKRLSNDFITHERCLKKLSRVYYYWYADRYIKEKLKSLDITFKQEIISEICEHIHIPQSRNIFLTDVDLIITNTQTEYIILFDLYAKSE